MEKFPENQNNNSESEKPAEKKGGFKNKLKVWLGLGATAAALTMTGCGKDANATNNVPTPTVDDGPKTESNIEDAGITTSGDVVLPGIDDDGNTGGNVVDGGEDSEWKVNPEQFWEGDTFHMDEYIEALGGNMDGYHTVFSYGDGYWSVYKADLHEIRIRLGEGEPVTLDWRGSVRDNSVVYVEYNDDIRENRKTAVDDTIAALDYLASANIDTISNYQNDLPSAWTE